MNHPMIYLFCDRFTLIGVENMGKMTNFIPSKTQIRPKNKLNVAPLDWKLGSFSQLRPRRNKIHVISLKSKKQNTKKLTY